MLRIRRKILPVLTDVVIQCLLIPVLQILVNDVQMLPQIMPRLPRRSDVTGELLVLRLLHREHHFLACRLFRQLCLMADTVHGIEHNPVGDQHREEQEEAARNKAEMKDQIARDRWGIKADHQSG